MKIRSLILGSVAAAGLSTAGYAADLGVLTSLDICDALGISGLTISSDTNCLQITGGVEYEFNWGDFRAAGGDRVGVVYLPFDGNANIITPGGTAPDVDLDWQSKSVVWLTAVAASESDFGKAQAVITIKQNDHPRYWNETYADNDGKNAGEIYFDEAYVSIGDSTVIMAGRKKEEAAGSIANIGDDSGFSFLDGWISSGVDGSGVLIDADTGVLGGDSIQVLSDFGNGLTAGVGLENIDGQAYGADPVVGARVEAGTLVGVISYAGEGISAHLTGAGVGVLDGDIGTWFAHAGATGTFDAFKIRAAAAYLHQDAGEFGISGASAAALATNDRDAWHALLSGSATFDLFTLALTGEYAHDEYEALGSQEAWSVAGSVGAQITEGVKINLGARYINVDTEAGFPLGRPGAGAFEQDAWQVAAQVVAALTETISVTGDIGAYFNEDTSDTTPAGEIADLENDGVFYAGLGLNWSPSDEFKSSIRGEANSLGAYRATFKASKTFK